MKRISDFLTFIRFSHTVFALPFALGAMFAAADGWPTWHVFLGVMAAMVFARSAAMTFNRIADWDIDQRNPRTAGRHKLVRRPVAIGLCAAFSVAFIASAGTLNGLCLALSPVALGVIFFYSFTKRFTHFAQLFLGLALAVAPVGAWLAVTGSFALPPLILAGAVLFWVAGFDLIYATQDVEVDRRDGLKSLVVWVGARKALRVAIVFHAIAFAGLVAFGVMGDLGSIYFLSLAFVIGSLVYEHCEAARGDMAATQRAFFQANALVGAAFVLGVLGDRLAAYGSG